MVGSGGGQPLLATVGTNGVTGEKGTMSKMSVDCGFMEMLPACTRSHRKKDLVEEKEMKTAPSFKMNTKRSGRSRKEKGRQQKKDRKAALRVVVGCCIPQRV